MLVTQEEESERINAAGLATMMTDGAFQEAFLAMRAELSVAHDLEELTEHEMKDQGMGVEAGSSASIAAAEAKVQAIRRNKNSKLSYLIVELCEQGRIDLVCSLPWAEEDAEDEISEIEKCLRSSARFSTLGDGDEEDFPATSRNGRGRGGVSLEAPPVDYYKAAYAFLVMHSNYRMAALEMYRLAKRLEDSTVYEDSVQRLERKIDALSAAHNCLCILQEGGEYPCLTFTFDDSGKAMNTGSGGGSSSSSNNSSRRTCLVTLKRVDQELTYALAAKQYLLVVGAAEEGGGRGGAAAAAAVTAPWRPLALVQSHPGTGEGKATKAMLHQIETASAQLCAVGLYESAAALVKAFGLPMTHIVASLAKTFVMLRSGRGDAPMVVEDGPRWNWGDPEEELAPDEHGGMGGEREDEEARRRVYHRLVQKLAEGGEEERVVAEHAEAAGWLLKDIVQGYDWAHAFELHTEAARYILACDSFFEMPRWLTKAFTRGVELRLVKKTNKKGGNNEAAAYVDRTTGRKLLPAANSGAFLQMHVDKAAYLVSSSPPSQMRRGEGGGAPPPPVAEGLLKEALYLLLQGLDFAMDMVDAINEQISGQAPQLWLPRTALLALVQRTREVVQIVQRSKSSDGVANLTAQEAEERVKLLLKRLLNSQLQIETLQQSAAITTSAMVPGRVGGGGGVEGAQRWPF